MPNDENIQNDQWLLKNIPISSGDSQFTSEQHTTLTEIINFCAKFYEKKGRRFRHIPEIYLHDFVANLNDLLFNSLSSPFDDDSISGLKVQSEQLLNQLITKIEKFEAEETRRMETAVRESRPFIRNVEKKSILQLLEEGNNNRARNIWLEAQDIEEAYSVLEVFFQQQGINKIKFFYPTPRPNLNEELEFQIKNSLETDGIGFLFVNLGGGHWVLYVYSKNGEKQIFDTRKDGKCGDAALATAIEIVTEKFKLNIPFVKPNAPVDQIRKQTIELIRLFGKAEEHQLIIWPKPENNEEVIPNLELNSGQTFDDKSGDEFEFSDQENEEQASDEEVIIPAGTSEEPKVQYKLDSLKKEEMPQAVQELHDEIEVSVNDFLKEYAVIEGETAAQAIEREKAWNEFVKAAEDAAKQTLAGKKPARESMQLVRERFFSNKPASEEPAASVTPTSTI